MSPQARYQRLPTQPPSREAVVSKEVYDDEPEGDSMTSSRRYRTLLSILLGLALLFTSIGWSANSFFRSISSSESTSSKDAVPKCEPYVPLLPSQTLNNPFLPLSPSEASQIRQYLHSLSSLSLTPPSSIHPHDAPPSSETDTFITLIELFPPDKQSVLEYIEGAEQPERWARAIIQDGTAKTIRDYLIGPLATIPSSTNATTESTSNKSAGFRLEPLTSIYTNATLPFHARMAGSFEGYQRFLTHLGRRLENVTLELYGGRATGEPGDTLSAGANTPISFDGSWRRTWMQFKRNVPGGFLHVLDLWMYVDLTSTKWEEWTILKVVHDRRVFDSLDAFEAAFHAGELKRAPLPFDPSDAWATRHKRGAPRDLEELPGPRSVSFNKPRFRVDREKGEVQWLGWEFWLGFERDMGLNFWNIRFLGERIIYEMSAQEAMAQYSGNDPHQASTVFLDRAFGMGTCVMELMIGYDCPHHSVLLPAVYHDGGGTLVKENAICIFEMEDNKPLTRHTAWNRDEMGASRGYSLTVRTISTVGNYDYLFDYVFRLDGSIEIHLSASGYLQGGYWESGQFDYGTQIMATSMGSLHDHVVNYKIDFDIAGRKNSMQAVYVEMEEKPEPWFMDEDWGSTVVQPKIQRRWIDNEDDSRVNWPDNFGGAFLIANKNQTNRWGNPRAYAIHPQTSTIHMTNLKSKRTLKNVNWAKQHVAVTKYHDNERWSSSQWNINLPGAPPVDFYEWFNSESLDQEDLVAWVSLGMHHIPRAEDSPMTLTNLAHSSLLLTPFNYFDYDISMDLQNSVILNLDEKGEWQIDQNGVLEGYCTPFKVEGMKYTGIKLYDASGNLKAAKNARRRRVETAHEIWAEL
ncbi:amine oxidase catalytic domain-containing protein [Atractiella rhizophila]|nr:amine oxidase catalytic domain-containing protein [Atractiella rhizophila]